MNDLFGNLREYFLQYSGRQRLLIVAVIIGIISSTITLVMWANRPEYELLYSNLTPESAGAIVDDLRSNDIKFRIENGGRSIYIPREFVSEMRLKFVQSGYISDGVSGYEIFEKSNMGMTTFMQQVNLQRALEGELTRTINQFPGVNQCRVHLVIPQSKLFEEKKQGSASVVLHINPGASLSAEQVNGIASLVASSVEGLEPNDVIVLDQKSNLLMDMAKDSETMGSVGSQWEMQHARESDLQNKVKGIVEGVVGPQNSVVKVSVDMNFDQVERTTEEVDPDKVVVLSEESDIESSFNVDDSSNFQSERTTVNYELSKKLEKYISPAGSIERITVAVLVNGKYVTAEDETGEKTIDYLPREEEELIRIEALVKSAVGYTEERGDIVEVQNIRFSDDTSLADEEYFRDMMQKEMWEKYITYGLLGLAILLAFILVRTLLKSSINILLPAAAQVGALPPGETTGLLKAVGVGKEAAEIQEGGGPKQMITPDDEAEISEDFYMAKLSPEARAKLKAKDKMTAEVIGFATNNPEDASKLIRTWLTQPRGK